MNILRWPVHSSWLFAFFFSGVTIGVIGSGWGWAESFASLGWLFSGIVLGGFGLWRRRAYVLVVMVIAGSLVGVWRGGDYKGQLAPYDHLAGQVVELRGRVADDSDQGKNGELVLRLDEIIVNDQSLKGNIWISTNQKADIKRSDKVTVKGRISEGFGGFAASIFRAELIKAERPRHGDVALEARDWFAGGVRQAVPEPEASLGVGYLTGQRRALPEDLDKALQVAGLTHIVVASGYNLTILVEAARRIFEKVSKFMATFSSAALIVGFIAVTGLSPSMSRAGLVAGLGLLAWYYGRRFHPFVLLSLAAAVTLLVNPAYGWGDLGWQLSFTSFIGVLIVAPLLQDYFFGSESPGVLRQVLGETVSAWLCTVPLIVVAFGQFSNVAIVANLLILPLVPLAMLLTFVAGAGALVLPSLAQIVGFPASLLLGYMTRMADYLGSLPWAQTSLAMSPYVVAVYYAVLFLICGYAWRRTRFQFIKHAPVQEDKS